jgi:hypothetical protein
MKIDKVIIAVDDNPTYVSFWNVVSPIWSEIFKIQPVLIFNGTTDEFNNLGFNVKENEFFIVNKIPNVSESRPDWAVTWSLFWGASKFENDVCMLTGIDQIPLGTFFFEQIEKFSNDDFVVGFSDAYRTYTKNSLGYFNTNTNVMYPSSHLVGKGKMFKEIFEINDLWDEEITKVHSCKDLYFLNCRSYPGKLWGLDECYSSDKIVSYENKNKIHHLDIFWNYWYKNRIDLSVFPENNIEFEKLKSGFYSELTTKNYFSHKPIIDKIVDFLKQNII